MVRSRLGACCVGCLLAAVAKPVAGQSWDHHGVVAPGRQFDAVSDGSDRIHVVSSEYVEVDTQGNVLVQDSSIGDEAQAELAFPPAIARAADGTLHIVTRHSGDYANGYELRYHRRNASGEWDVDMVVGEKVPRNYVVGLAVVDDGSVFFAHSREATNGALVSFYSLTGGNQQALGSFTDETWLRSDADFRMRGAANRVVVATGSPWPDGHVHFFATEADTALVNGLIASHKLHKAGSGRRGMPDLSLSEKGAAALVYGAYHQVFHVEYDQDGTQEEVDSPIFDDLGDWAFSLGLSAVGITSDGALRLAVGLRSDGSNSAADCDLLYAYAQAGQPFSVPTDMGVQTNGGGGRLRPRISAIGHTFYLLYVDNQSAGISMASLNLGGGEEDAGVEGGIDVDSGVDGGGDSSHDSGAGHADAGGWIPMDAGADAWDGESGMDAAASSIEEEQDDGCSCGLATSASHAAVGPWLILLGIGGWLARRRSGS